MPRAIETKLREAEQALGQQMPGDLFAFIAGLSSEEYAFANESWLFWTVTDKPTDRGDNFIIDRSASFRTEWKLNGFVFATNGIGDYLVLLPDKESGSLMPTIFIMLHETAELKVFAADLDTLLTNGPRNYHWSDEFYLKLEEEQLIEGKETVEGAQGEDDEESDYFGPDYQKRSTLDDWIDEEKTEKTSEIISGLEELSQSTDESHRIWAINKLSDLYLKGFGPLPAHVETAMAYNQMAMDLGSHKAFSNRAACYFAGIGVERDLPRALILAKKANELSKSNMFADVVATKEGGGFYDAFIEIIEKEMERLKNNTPITKRRRTP
jgi:hypothetical protein